MEVYTAVTHTCPHLEHEIGHESEGQRTEKVWEMWEKCFNLWTLVNNKSISWNGSACFVQKKKCYGEALVHGKEMQMIRCILNNC